MLGTNGFVLSDGKYNSNTTLKKLQGEISEL
jgi:hypothetical protein